MGMHPDVSGSIPLHPIPSHACGEQGPSQLIASFQEEDEAEGAGLLLLAGKRTGSPLFTDSGNDRRACVVVGG